MNIRTIFRLTYSLLKWILLTIINIIANIANLPLAPIVVLFASDDGWLPSWLAWFQTPDNSLDGDYGWKTTHLKFKNSINPIARWFNRTRWLWRNSMYGFSESVLGAKIKSKFKYKCIGSENVSNRPLLSGLVLRIAINHSGEIFWQMYYVKAWSEKYCIRINLGWKLWGGLSADTIRPIVLSVNPLMGYSK